MDLTLLYLFGYGSFLVLVGYILPYFKNKLLTRIIAWSLIVTTVFVATLLTWHHSPLFRMIAIVTLQLLSMKVLVMIETYAGENKLTVVQWIAFSTAWFGMRPKLFESLPSKSLAYFYLVIKGALRIIAGVILVYLSVLAENLFGEVFYLSDLLLLAGLSLILHFGILNLSTALWRLMGVAATELFKAPYKSKSLKEFWGKRWNLAFSEMTALIAYRPLKTKIGAEPAIIISFLLSGILHEIAISFPVHAGYGFPLLYFAIHAVLMYAEDKFEILKKIIRDPVLSHSWVMTCLLLPMPLLFHAQFIHFVLMPMRIWILNFFGITIA